MSAVLSSDAMNNLVKFMILLAILGIILALVIGYVTGSPAGIQAPLNTEYVNPQIT